MSDESTEKQSEEDNVVEFNFYSLSNLTAHLIELIEHEIELLSESKIQEIDAIQDEKNEIAKKLEAQQVALKTNPKYKETLTKDQIQNLRELAQRYEETIAVYQRELFKAQQVNQMTVKIIADIFMDFANKDKSYAANGSRNGHHKDLSGYTPALKFNESI